MAVNAETLLNWYDANARIMPWRVSPDDRRLGVLPDPYQVWLSEIMLQQTTVAAVDKYFRKFVGMWPQVEDLAAAKDEDVMAAWAGLGYYTRARNLLKCARIVASELDGKFPSTEAELQKLPGIGPYTSAAIASIAFDQPATVLDGNVERVMSRIFAALEPLPDVKPVLRAHAESLTPQTRPGDYAQAVMDLGATICTPRNPDCGRCVWKAGCAAQAQGIAETLPRKRPKAEKPVRYGTVYIAQKGNKVLVEKRPEKGLLGGMFGWPGTDWKEDSPKAVSPFSADWSVAPETVSHVFTHFRLELNVATSQVSGDYIELENLHFRGIEIVDAMPTVMRKAWKVAQNRLK